MGTTMPIHFQTQPKRHHLLLGYAPTKYSHTILYPLNSVVKVLSPQYPWLLGEIPLLLRVLHGWVPTYPYSRCWIHIKTSFRRNARAT